MFSINPGTAEKLVLDRKTIPAKVFYNHFIALACFINSHSNRFRLNSIDYFNRVRRINQNNNNEIKKLLWNGWSTEYAMRIAQQLNNDDYYRYSLHWSFPQAYYSAYHGYQAFQAAIGTQQKTHEKSIKSFSKSVEHGHYPKAVSFYSCGPYNAFTYIGLDSFSGIPEGFKGLSEVASLEEAKNQIAMFLKTTREYIASGKMQDKKNSLLTKKGLKAKRIQKWHWNEIFLRMYSTTIFSLLYRLRLKANYHYIDTFLHADIDYKAFNKALTNIVDYLNFVHEAYIAKAIGVDDYEEMLFAFSNHFSNAGAKNRYEQLIKPLFA